MTTIPYEIKNGGPSSEILEKLIESMTIEKYIFLMHYILKKPPTFSLFY